MIKEFYHYTLEKNIPSIRLRGMYGPHPVFTDTEYYDKNIAEQKLGVMAHYIDCVLKFKNDGLYKDCGVVPSTGRFDGGGKQYQHHGNPKPIAVRKIKERIWKSLVSV